ncbi:DUF302 domain-containing protein [methanotrophic endosymbiont of Bathymodiolus puteoserpentis (Logatchev)]|jgi:uncharacterized protein (DUF302 family)|uniref:DUF302 domain-containing protein n=1 Tax=methanotrophic endosymbiont of Bathymodiolus puteoserpentis (Logatchev) TaxID=343235 RepID=UPI0013CDC9BA|nr:DUF302 domain-containing protein [methanotrophic endosymbiont of Bathymodiolus puteoserpentis (Logatchev)]SHE20185.1 lipoprotein, putative [methanotrophic endosymbiont of Bathymodiolus puteoserpentis (Logatchev)]
MKLLTLQAQHFLLLAALLILNACAPTPVGEFIPYYQAETEKPYADVLAELEIAISEHNFRITGHSRVGKVIRDRGTKNFPEYDTLQFCNLTHAKTLLLMSPHAVRHMPCNIVTYQFQGKTIVRTHLMPTNTDNPELNRFSAKMNIMLKAMVDFAVE